MAFHQNMERLTNAQVSRDDAVRYVASKLIVATVVVDGTLDREALGRFVLEASDCYLED